MFVFIVVWPVPQWFSGFRKNAIEITRFLGFVVFVVVVVVVAAPPPAGTGELCAAGTAVLTLRITTIKGLCSRGVISSRSRGVILSATKRVG